MRLRLLNLTYLVMAIIAVGWVVSDLYSAYSASVLTSATGSVWSEGSISAFFNIPIVAGFLIVLFAVYKYPEHTRDQKRKKHKKSSAQTRINAVTPALEQTSEKKPKVKQPLKDKEIGDVQSKSDISINTDSSSVDMESTTLDVDDYFLNPPKDDEREQAESLSLKPLLEAQALVILGEIDHAVDMLLDAVSESESGSESDAIASRLMTIINDELNDESISAVRDVHFRLKRDQVVTSLSKKRSKLSDATLRKIQMDNPMQEDDGYFDPVKVSVVR